MALDYKRISANCNYVTTGGFEKVIDDLDQGRINAQDAKNMVKDIMYPVCLGFQQEHHRRHQAEKRLRQARLL